MSNMYQITIWVIAICLSTLIVVLHIMAMRLFGRLYCRVKIRNFIHIGLGTAYFILLHFLSILIFCCFYLILTNVISDSQIVGANSLKDYLYFSAISYTSLGYGDLYPLGAARVFAAIEAIVGLSMIGWTVTFSYKYAIHDLFASPD